MESYCQSMKYDKIINDLSSYIINELKIKLDNKLQPLIKEINNDKCN